MEEKSSFGRKTNERQTQWEGLFVTEHAWNADNDFFEDPQPMLSAHEQKAIADMLLVAFERKCPVFIQSWQDRHFHYQRCTIQELDWEEQMIICEEPLGGRQLAIGAITSIHMLD